MVLRKCEKVRYAFNALKCVNTVVTELCVIQIAEGKMTVTAMAPDITKEDLQSRTDATLHFVEDISTMLVD